MTERRRTATSTSNFGVSRREAHDATAFYARFEPPEVSTDASVAGGVTLDDAFIAGDARHMAHLPDNSVALVVTSPPYFAGKQYEEELERDGVPSSYIEYLTLLRDVFGECKRVLEPGGRIAVNVANLGRKPYRSLSSDVTRILQDELHLLLRGEVIWQKGEGASGSCAWGSFRSASNPVLRDITERVIIASKGRFDRAVSAKARQRQGLPHQNSLTSDEFMAATLDVWEMLPESARRVQHPAPFPVELPERLIRLYTYEDDLVLDPFMGSGSTLVAAARLGRRYVGYDLDPDYVEIARRRVTTEALEDPHRRAATEGKAASAIAERVLEEAGFSVVGRNARVRGVAMAVSFVAVDAGGRPWYFDLTGGYTTTKAGLLRTDAVWRAVGRAHVLARREQGPVVLMATHLPKPGSDGDTALRAAGPGTLYDVVELYSADGAERLKRYARRKRAGAPLPGFWGEEDLAGR